MTKEEITTPGVKVSVVSGRQTDGGRWIETATLTPSFFFSWPYHAVLSSRSHLALLCFSAGGGYSTRGQLYAFTPVECLATRWHFSEWLNLCWLQAETPRPLPDSHSISCGHLHISFHIPDIFPFHHMTASAYFNRCVLCRESLIDI